MTECEGYGKNVEKAIEDALSRLHVNRDDVDIKILETGGLFKKAKVHVSLSQEYLDSHPHKQNTPPQEKQVEPLEQECETNCSCEEKCECEAECECEDCNCEEECECQENCECDCKHYEEEQENQKDDVLEIGTKFLEGFLKTLGYDDCTVVAQENQEDVTFNIQGERASDLIGYRGDCLNNIQYLLSVITAKNNRKAKRARLDIGYYKERRKETLESLARRIAAKVERTGKEYKLEPMTAYERRIIHTTVQEFETVTSISKGEEPHRYLIVMKKED